MFLSNIIRTLWFLILLLLATVVFSAPTQANVVRDTMYDLSIKKWTNHYTPDVDWTWNKAQLIAESLLDPKATSPVGAMGIAQFMPPTWRDMEQQLGFRGSAYNPSLAIQAQAYYMGTLRRVFKAPRPEWDKHSLALASYNAGLGNIIKAQRLGGNSLMYSPMIGALPRVTGASNSTQTRTYVIRIWGLVERIKNERNIK